MKTYEYKPYTIQVKTNLHVGAGDNNFGVIDNQVQKDLLTKLPIINSSSLKGALREYFKDLVSIEEILAETEAKTENKKGQTFINFVFGSEAKSSDEDKTTTESNAGIFQFLSALLIAFPIRSEDEPFKLVTAPFVVDMLRELENDFGVSLNLPTVSLQEQTNIVLEDREVSKYQKVDSGPLKGVYIVEDNIFKELMQSLPFIPRNHLDNGESKNLWYEEIVPRESRFLFLVGMPKDELIDFKTYEKKLDYPKIKKQFEDNLINHLVQIGANASIGYGLCKIEKAKGESDEQTDK